MTHTVFINIKDMKYILLFLISNTKCIALYILINICIVGTTINTIIINLIKYKLIEIFLLIIFKNIA